jgi:beta-galactosidase
VRIEDKNSVLVPRSSNIISFSVTGPAKIIATDNGDATSHESFQSATRKAYNGMALAIVKAEKGASGSFTVKAVSKGLKERDVVVKIE